MENNNTDAANLAQRIHEHDHYTRRASAADDLPFQPFELHVVPFTGTGYDNEISTALVNVYEPTEPGEDSMNKQRVIAFNCGSNGYIRGRDETLLHQVAAKAAEDSGYPPGATGSRFMNGNTPALASLEQRMAEHVGYEHAVVLNTGYNANYVAIKTLISSRVGVLDYKRGKFQKTAAIQAKGGVHASVAEPIASLQREGYVADREELGLRPVFNPEDPETLHEVLDSIKDADVSDRIVFVNGVGSVDGLTYDIKRIQEICKEYGALLFVDDAHGGFTLGTNAKGICEYLGLDELPDFYFATFSKSLEAGGGVLLTNHDGFKEAFKYQPESIYTAAFPPLMAEMIHTKLDYIQAYPDSRQTVVFDQDGTSTVTTEEHGVGEAMARKSRLFNDIIERGAVSISRTNPDTPIYALEVDGDNFKGYASWHVLLHEFGVYTNFFPLESSGKGKAVLRFSLSSNMSDRVIQIIAARVVQWSQQLKNEEQLNREQMAEILQIPVDDVEDLMMPA